MLTDTSHLREQFLAEDFRGRSVAEALSRCRVEPIADVLQLAVGDRQWIDLSRKPFANPAVDVLDRAFLPGRLRIAEPYLRSDAGLQIRPLAEFGPAVEGDGASSRVGQGLEHLNQPVHDRFRLPLVVALEDRKAADPLHQ